LTKVYEYNDLTVLELAKNKIYP